MQVNPAANKMVKMTFAIVAALVWSVSEVFGKTGQISSYQKMQQSRQLAQAHAWLQKQPVQPGHDTQFPAVQDTQSQENLARAASKANEFFRQYRELWPMPDSLQALSQNLRP